jgi:hypothetical protein
VQFYVEGAPGSFPQGTALQEDDLAMAPAVFGGMLSHMVDDLDAQLESAT